MTALRKQSVSKARPDVQAIPLPESGDPVNLYIDRSSCRTDTGLRTGFAVVSCQNGEFVIKSHHLPKEQSLKLYIKPDSAYCYFVVHRDLGSWVRNGWKTAAGGPPKKHKDLARGILKALGGRKRLAVIKITTHTGDKTFHGIVNEGAERAAKRAAGLNVANIIPLVEVATPRKKTPLNT